MFPRILRAATVLVGIVMVAVFGFGVASASAEPAGQEVEANLDGMICCFESRFECDLAGVSGLIFEGWAWYSCVEMARVLQRGTLRIALRPVNADDRRRGGTASPSLPRP